MDRPDREKKPTKHYDPAKEAAKPQWTKPKSEKKKNAEFGPEKDFRVTVSLKTVTPHLRSIVPNVQRHMAYFAAS